VEPSLAKEGRGGSKNLTGWIEKIPPFFKPQKSEASRKRSLAQISLAAYPII